MSDYELWASIDAQRVRVADLLDSLSTDEWAHPSLCEGWTVRDVAAHLTLQQLRVRDALWSVVRHPWSYGGRGHARVFASPPLDGYRFRATDVAWSSGSGPKVEGPIAAILLLLTGRTAALPELSGVGADDLRRRFTPV